MSNIVTKNKEGYGYKYTDISEIHRYLEENNMSYYQYIDRIDGDDYIMTVKIINGEEKQPIRGSRVVQATLSGIKNPAQEQGSALTYARRYSLLMAFGLATDDDDAQSLTIKEIKTEKDAREIKITFGKHNGKTIGQLYDNGEEKYLTWLFDNTKDENIKKAISILTGLADVTPEETKEIVNSMPIQEGQKQRLKDKYKDNLDELQLQIANLGKLKLSQLTYEEAERLLGDK
jgi:hypothetical protein